MIKPLSIPQLTSAKPRTGLTSISDLIPRLIQQYEIQAEFNRQQEKMKAARAASKAATKGISKRPGQSEIPAGGNGSLTPTPADQGKPVQAGGKVTRGSKRSNHSVQTRFSWAE